jgi:hypothetical protein
MGDKELNKMYTIKEAIEYIEAATDKEFKDRKLMYLIRNKKVEATKVGWIWVIPEEEVKRLVQEHK